MKTYSGTIVFATYALITLGVVLIKPIMIPDAAFIVFCLSGVISGYIDGFKGMKSALLAMGVLVILYILIFGNAPHLVLNLILIMLTFMLYFFGHVLGSLAYGTMHNRFSRKNNS